MKAVLVLFALVAAAPAARAQESDEVLSKQLSAVARDPRESLAARVTAVRSLGKLGPRAAAAVPDLAAVLDRLRGTEQQPLQEALAETLGLIGSPAKAAVPSLTRAAGRSIDTDLAIRRSTEQILGSSDELDVDALARQLASRDASIRVRAAKALGSLGPAGRAAMPSLAAVLGDSDGDVRRAALNALRLIDPNIRPNEAIVRAFAADLRDPDSGVRLLAVRTLGRIGALSAIVAADIDALRNDPDPDVRRAATEALARIGAAP